MSSVRPFAVFDIDGTLIRWQLYHALADELARAGHIDPIQYQAVREARLIWKKRTEATSYQDYERTLVNLVDDAISGIRVADLQRACQSVLHEYKDQVYTYTRDLIRELKQKNYLLFAISASQIEIISLLAEYYGFDDYGGSVYEAKGDNFTGQKDILKSDRKPEFLKQLIAKHQTSLDASIGVGDSESDIPMLNMVQTPIAFNPTKALFSHAQARGWTVILERKNMIYRLQAGEQGYRLVERDES